MSSRKRKQAHYLNMGTAKFKDQQFLNRLLARVLSTAGAQA